MQTYEVNLLESFQWMTSGELAAFCFHPVIGRNIVVRFRELTFAT
jgi:hypothetical protein